MPRLSGLDRLTCDLQRSDHFTTLRFATQAALRHCRSADVIIYQSTSCPKRAIISPA